jgi:copper resistance protein B
MIDFTHIFRIVTGILLLVVAAAPQVGHSQVMDDKTYSYLLFDQLEYAPGPSERPIGLDATGWVGGDINRLWVRAGGEQSTVMRDGEAEIEVLYGRLITPFFDAVVGTRLDTRWGATDNASRGFLAVGVHGLAPYWFEIEPTVFVSHEGNLSAHFAASYELLFTQRLIMEPELEMTAALQEVPDWSIGSGINEVAAGLRLRYEISRKFAPYIGYAWDRALGATADLARTEGEEVSHGTFVFGVRLWR